MVMGPQHQNTSTLLLMASVVSKMAILVPPVEVKRLKRSAPHVNFDHS